MSEIYIKNKLTIRQITNRFSSIIMFFVVLVFFIFTDSQTSSYIEEQKHSANKATEVTSSEIQQILSNKSRQVNAFLNQNIKLITQIVDDPKNEDLILDLNSRLHEYSLDFFATTIAAATGKALIDDFDGLIEDVCISDIKQYEKDGFPNIRIHPNPHEHHYDVIANFSHNGEKYLFLSSFKPDELTSLLRAAQPSFHHLMLVTNNEQPLIELSTSGTRNQMPHRNNYHLDEDETDRILSSTIVPNTAWKVIDLYSPGLLSDFRLKVILQGLFILILIALILLIMRHFIIHSERELEIAKDAA
ncbi:MAG: hypothetical protein KAJ95_08155, partial [Gammaproteobacteria bacterium]|nr:hypothetical protein [Gammaproteobacteria bacterium]